MSLNLEAAEIITDRQTSIPQGEMTPGFLPPGGVLFDSTNVNSAPEGPRFTPDDCACAEV